MRRSLLLILAALPAPAAAQGVAAPVPAIIAAPPDPLGDLATRQREEESRCRQGGLDGIIVCGRRGGGYRIPWEPEPGARVRVIAGEAPSAMAAMGAGGCIRLCEQPLRFNLLDPGSIVRGIDRILGRN